MSKKQEIEQKLKSITDTWNKAEDINGSLAEQVRNVMEGKGDRELANAVIKEANKRRKIKLAELKK